MPVEQLCRTLLNISGEPADGKHFEHIDKSQQIRMHIWWDSLYVSQIPVPSSPSYMGTTTSEGATYS